MIPTEWPADRRELRGGWELSGSSLVAPSGESFAPDDLVGLADVAEMRAVPYQTLVSGVKRGSSVAGPGWRRIGRNSGWAVFAADAVRA